MIIGITGTNGSGKGTVVDYLVSKGFVHYSARDFITTEIKRRGLPVDRDSMREVANDLRKVHGATYIIESLFKQAEIMGGSALIESVREVEGAQFLKKHGATIIAVDANPHMRYERITHRGSATDAVSFEEFCRQEEQELKSDDPTKQSVLDVMVLADDTILNNGTLEELRGRVDAALASLGGNSE